MDEPIGTYIHKVESSARCEICSGQVLMIDRNGVNHVYLCAMHYAQFDAAMTELEEEHDA